MQTLHEMLRESLWAAALTEAELDAVMRESHERHVPLGGLAMRCGDHAEHWIGVIDGLIKMSVTQADGRQATFTGVTAGGPAKARCSSPARGATTAWQHANHAWRACRVTRSNGW